MKAGILIDTWKLSIFERHLKQSGYVFTNGGAPTQGTLLLSVETENPAALKVVVQRADQEAADTGEPRTTMTDGSPVTEDHRTINPRTGQQKGYVVLSPVERAQGFVRPLRKTYAHTKCGAVTTMSQPIAETYARDPKFYSGTFCVGCRLHFPLSEFTWEGTNEVVGS